MSEKIIQSILLPSLQGVKKVHAGTRAMEQWRALCPACQGEGKSRDPKLSIALSTTGAVLVHCNKCSSGLPALKALGLDFSDLYQKPQRGHQHFVKGSGGPWAWLTHASMVDALLDAHVKLLGLVAPSLDPEIRVQALTLILRTGELAQAVKESARAAYRAAVAAGNGRGAK